MKKWIPIRIKHKLKNFFSLEYGRSIEKGKNVFVARTAVLECRGGGYIKVGDDTEILDGVLLLTYGGNITIGKNCSINPYTIIYGHGNTVIGDDVLIAGHCMIIPNNHNYMIRDSSIRNQGSTARGIIIENDVWLGHSCSILDGVQIGYGSIIGAGSVVTENVLPFSVMAGVPARLIRQR